MWLVLGLSLIAFCLAILGGAFFIAFLMIAIRSAGGDYDE